MAENIIGDHINAYSKSPYKIGRFYSNFAHSEFECEDGVFSSIEAYWYWIITGGQSPKNTFGFEAKSIGKSFEVVQEIDQEKIKKALDIKIKNNIVFIKEEDRLDLPLKHYYVYGEKVVNAGHEWIIEHLNMRREQLKEHFKNKDGDSKR